MDGDIASRDKNSVTTLMAVSLADGRTPVDLWADPVTHALLTTDSASGAAIVNVYNEFATGTIDGVNTVFNFANEFTLGTTRVYLNGARQALGVDYTETSDSQITFTVAPPAPITGGTTQLFWDYQLLVLLPTTSDLLLQDNTGILLQDSSSLILQS